MSRYSYTVLYVRGDKNVVADALSRILTLPDDGELPLPYSEHPDLLLTLRTSGPRPTSGPGSGYGRSGGSNPQGHSSLIEATTGSSALRSATPRLDGGGTRLARHSGASDIAFFDGIRTVAIGGRTRRSPGTSVGEFGGSRCSDPNDSGKNSRSSHTPSNETFDDSSRNPKASKRARVSFSYPLESNGPSSFRVTPNLISNKVDDSTQSSAHHLQSELANSDLVNLSPSVPTAQSKYGSHCEQSQTRLVGRADPCVPAAYPDDEIQADPLMSSYDQLVISLVDRIKLALHTDADTKTDHQLNHWGLHKADGMLWHNNRLYIPNANSLRSDLSYWHHDVPWCAHLGITKTVEMVKRQFYWPRMDKDIAQYVSSCLLCQANKTDRRNKTPPLTPLIPPDS